MNGREEGGTGDNLHDNNELARKYQSAFAFILTPRVDNSLLKR